MELVPVRGSPAPITTNPSDGIVVEEADIVTTDVIAWVQFSAKLHQVIAITALLLSFLY